MLQVNEYILWDSCIQNPVIDPRWSTWKNNTFTIFAKNSILNLWKGLNICWDLNMSEFWIFASFCWYERVLNMFQDAIMEAFWIFQDFKYAKFLCRQVLHKVLSMPEYDWMPYGRVLNMSGQHVRFLDKLVVLNMLGLRIWQDCKYVRVTQCAECAWISLSMP